MPSADDKLIMKIVAETLFIASEWVSDHLAHDFADIARYVAKCHVKDWTCCPVCDEIVCDDDCPLYVVRLHAKMWRE